MSHVVVASAGTLGIEGAPASDEAIRALAEVDIDLTGHRSRALSTAERPAADALDLDDPIGAPLSVFRKQREIIRSCVDHLVLYLKHETIPS